MSKRVERVVGNDVSDNNNADKDHNGNITCINIFLDSRILEKAVYVLKIINSSVHQTFHASINASLNPLIRQSNYPAILHASIRQAVFLSISSSIIQVTHPETLPSLNLPMNLSVSSSSYPSTYQFIRPAVYPSLTLSIHPSINHLSINPVITASVNHQLISPVISSLIHHSKHPPTIHPRMYSSIYR